MNKTLVTLCRYLQLWDPIGVIEDLARNGHALSEYDSYAGPLYTLLAEGGTVQDVKAYLEKCLETMGIPSAPERDEPIANGVHRYFNKVSGFKGEV